jgi:hypothetical protein
MAIFSVVRRVDCFEQLSHHFEAWNKIKTFKAWTKKLPKRWKRGKTKQWTPSPSKNYAKVNWKSVESIQFKELQIIDHSIWSLLWTPVSFFLYSKVQIAFVRTELLQRSAIWFGLHSTYNSELCNSYICMLIVLEFHFRRQFQNVLASEIPF